MTLMLISVAPFAFIHSVSQSLDMFQLLDKDAPLFNRAPEQLLWDRLFFPTLTWGHSIRFLYTLTTFVVYCYLLYTYDLFRGTGFLSLRATPAEQFQLPLLLDMSVFLFLFWTPPKYTLA
jgi:hypothetical protein